MTKNQPKPFICFKGPVDGKIKLIARKVKTKEDWKIPADATQPKKVEAVNCVAAKVIYRNVVNIGKSY